MKSTTPAASPDAYVAALTGWQRTWVEKLRKAVRASAQLEERIKWGHLVYIGTGPVLLIRAEECRVLFGFWRGQRLREIAPALKPGGKYEMATLILDESSKLPTTTVRALVSAAVALNQSLGDPTDLAALARPDRSAKSATPSARDRRPKVGLR